MKTESDTLNICLACDDNYAPHAAACIASIGATKNEEDRPRFFILSDGLSEAVKQRFHEMASLWNFPLSILECTDDMFKGLRTWKGKYNAYYRLAIHRILPADISKVLYLDSDVIVATSLAPLFHTDISERYAAVVAESKDSTFTTHDFPYFNSGMMLFNLEKYKKEEIERKAIELGTRRFSEIDFPDQDLLNELFAGNVVFLPYKWNMKEFPANYHRAASVSGRTQAFSMEDLKAAYSNPAIVHFNCYPWNVFCPHPLRHLYWKHLRSTPFYRDVVKKYYANWLSSFYQRYFRINISKRNLHVKFFGVDLISRKF